MGLKFVYTISMDYKELPWNFEAFRRFLPFTAIQNAASVACLYDGLKISAEPHRLFEFQNLLNSRSGMEWEPKRIASEDIKFDIEGNVFRNKARVLTSLFLLDPIALKNDNQIIVTPFGKALGAGLISEKDFYDEIIVRFQYPHPAYEENWFAWRNAGVTLKPFLFILEILYNLALLDEDRADLTITEFAHFAHDHPTDDPQDVAKSILDNRSTGNQIDRIRSDKVERKIGDIFGFLCLTQYCYFDNNKICLNLVRKHPEELVHFRIKRNNADVIADLRQLIASAQ